jgi:hypothetical protein
MVPLLALVVVLVGVVALALGRMGGAAAARADAQTAADAAALAGAAGGRSAAESLAAANGARIVSFEQDDRDTRVVVEVGPAQAIGKARRDAGGGEGGSGGGGSGGGGGGSGTAGSREGLAPAMKAALARAEQILGHEIPITSGYRSREEQERLYANRANNPYPVAVPGSSRHEQGLAIDVPTATVPELARVGPGAGLCHPFPEADPVHFELCR